MKRFAYSALAAGTMILAAGMASPAQAVTTVYSMDGTISLSDNSFGSQNGIHFLQGVYSGDTIDGYVNQDNSLVTFQSSSLTGADISGNGEATLHGNLSDLTITFAKGWDSITLSLASDVASAMTLTVNGATSYTFGGAACGTLCAIADHGQNKFTITGTDITSLVFGFNPSLDGGTVKQVRVDDLGQGAVPEPSTWAMILLGFGMAGVSLRARGKRAVRVLA